MSNAWPWPKEPRDPPPEVVADYENLLRLGIWASRAQIDEMASLMAAGVPEGGPVRVTYEVKGPGACEVSMEHADCQLQKTFYREGGYIEVDFHGYFIPSHKQKTGCARRLFRNLAHCYIELGVATVVTRANCEGGGYAWARMGARPIEWKQTQQLLLARLDATDWHGSVRPDELDAVKRCILHGPPERVMYDLACSVGGDDVQIGSDLLLGQTWQAFWDLTDSTHRQLIAEAMS